MRSFDQAELAKAGRVMKKKFAVQNLTLADAHDLAIMQELRNNPRCVGWEWLSVGIFLNRI